MGTIRRAVRRYQERNISLCATISLTQATPTGIVPTHLSGAPPGLIWHGSPLIAACGIAIRFIAAQKSRIQRMPICDDRSSEQKHTAGARCPGSTLET
jgi:hypothetical protein